MMDNFAVILLLALILDWFLGEPQEIWSRVPHPVVLFGKAVGLADKVLNIAMDAPAVQYRKGALAICMLLVVAYLAAIILEWIIGHFGLFSWVFECLTVFVLLAQRSLFDHVQAVSEGLRRSGIEGGREAVGLIVGRDPELLDEKGICRASIETLAENFSDGVLAPAFWFGVFGLPGLFIYKMINTADSMIAYRSEKYLHFGKLAAQIDDLANWLPARLSFGIIAVGATFVGGIVSAKNAVSVVLRDAGLHRSPNAGWPEAAMAGAMDIALGGPRKYAHETVSQAFINGSGKHELSARDIETSLEFFRAACFVFWGLVLAIVVLN
ncbi:MAG: adenosylcobinamide-phosphate synthase CbiB [Rhizobiaceae bacterium]